MKKRVAVWMLAVGIHATIDKTCNTTRRVASECERYEVGSLGLRAASHGMKRWSLEAHPASVWQVRQLAMAGLDPAA